MSAQWIYIFAVASGSALGGVLRFLTREYLPVLVPIDFPIGTLVVNVLGCFVAGILLIYWQGVQVNPVLKAAIMIGFLGALTTFSSFSVDTLVLFQEQQFIKAVTNVALNMALSLIAVFLGAWIGGRITQI
ncbi:fluoride efflux transporter CrcB [Pleionea sediminis]|uniref:fluoride efflux transporter CrcB n=1 Tax=Pleionea sediminis TaxID=2569479 RepID=UPI001185B75E|nr:fluoride efflux transporter CrcB [Pleionea sediminis]